MSTIFKSNSQLGHDLESLLYAFMDEFLFVFSTELFVCKEVSISEFDVDNFKIKAHGSVLFF
jgi:SHS2 domain-containing protein